MSFNNSMAHNPMYNTAYLPTYSIMVHVDKIYLTPLCWRAARHGAMLNTPCRPGYEIVSEAGLCMLSQAQLCIAALLSYNSTIKTLSISLRVFCPCPPGSPCPQYASSFVWYTNLKTPLPADSSECMPNVLGQTCSSSYAS